MEVVAVPSVKGADVGVRGNKVRAAVDFFCYSQSFMLGSK